MVGLSNYRERGIPVNVSHDKNLCDFYFPGIVKKGQTVVGISASGADHKNAKEVTESIKDLMNG